MTDMPTKDYAANSRRMAIKQKGGKWAPHAVRLRVLRCALFNENSSQFAKRLHISVQRINNMENGFPISIDVANKIRLAAPGITLDWLYHGDERAVPGEMLMRLREESAKPEHTPPS
jgi:transcriptional regulator with XRE-family HTH domain